jgi:hypothetical protein
MNRRFPLPVDHAHAPLVCARRSALLCLLVAFVAGVFTGGIVFGVLLLRVHAS